MCACTYGHPLGGGLSFFREKIRNAFTITAQILACSLAKLLSSISGQTHEFITYVMQQRPRADNLTVCYFKKTNVCQFFMHLSCYRLWILSQRFQSSLQIHSAIASWIHSYFDDVMTKFMVNNRTDTWKSNVNLLNVRVLKSGWKHTQIALKTRT